MDLQRVSSWSLGFTTVIVCIALGVAGGAWLFSPTSPEVLSPVKQTEMVPVSEKVIDDSRGVEIVVTTVDGGAVGASTSGKVTSLSCDSETVLTSGTSNLSVDGVASINLATSMPLWRNLTLGDKGEDVVALQTELARLGYDVLPDGDLGEWTLQQAADLLSVPAEELKDFKAIPIERLLWIPAPQVTVKSCEVEIGSLVQTGDTLFAFADKLSDARIKQMPQNLTEGARVLRIDELEISIGDDGEISDESALAALEESSEYHFLVSNPDLVDSIPAQLRLAVPMTAYSVPPASIYDLEGNAGCVLAEDGGFPVRVVSSELGQTLVEFTDTKATPAHVNMLPDGAPPCR